MSNNLPIEIEEILQNNYDNARVSLSFLRRDSLWHHFEFLSHAYAKTGYSGSGDSYSSYDTMVLTHLLAGSPVNMAKGICNVLSGHFTDSNIHIRKTIESLRYAIFFRENPGLARMWFSPNGRTEYEPHYRTWWKNGGKQVVLSEVPDSDIDYSHSSNHGPHANPELFANQHEIRSEGQLIRFKVKYHEIEPNEDGYLALLSMFMWHVSVHFKSIDWWIRRSHFVRHLDDAFIELWREREIAINKDQERIREQFKRRRPND